LISSSYPFLDSDGTLIVQYLGTAPNFMFGMFFLALFLSIGRLYQEAWLKRKEV